MGAKYFYGRHFCDHRYLWALFIFMITWFIGSIAFAQEFRAATLASYGDVTVLEVEGNYDADIPEAHIARQAIAREFFKTHPDNYDFLVIFSNFDFRMPADEIVGFYSPVSNNVHGIGQEIFDNASTFGSNGRLQGTIDMGSLDHIVSDPLAPQFSFTMGVLSHELLHRWAAFVKFKKSDGSISTGLLLEDGSHWSFLLDTQGSLQYGNRWQDNGDGTFTSLEGRKYFSPLDLYLMGLIDRSQVPPILLIENPNVDPNRISEAGVTIEGSARAISIDDIIAAEGERIPGVAQSQKSFKIGAICITRPGTFTGTELFSIRTVMHNWVMWFSSLTDGKASVFVDATALQDIAANPGVTPPSYEPRTTPPQIDDGVAWLMANQEDDGSWIGTLQTVERDTSGAVLALANFADSAQSVAVARRWLADNPSENLDYLARKTEALSLAGGDVTQLLDDLLAGQNPDGGWGSSRYYMSNPTDSSFALRSLAATGYSERSVIEPAVAYLKAEQNPDGSWGSHDKGSSIQATANVLDAFSQYRATFQLDDQIQSGVLWLMGKQNPDGGFGNSPSTVYDTAIAVLILKALNVSSAITTQALDYILGLQSEDGSWYKSPYQTALAVNAIWKATIDPDLSVSTADISFEPPSVTHLPANITVAAEIWNLGLTDAAQAKVALYDGAVSEAGKLAEQTLDFPGKSSVRATFTLTITDGNAHRFYLVVDPEGLVQESSKFNNTAIKVLYPETTYDFEVLPSDVAVSPDTIDLLQNVTITSKLTNKGTANAYNVPLRYYIDAPQGPLDIAGVFVDIPAGGTISHQITWTAGRPGADLNLTVQVDADDGFSELSESNNKASTLLTVIQPTKANLTLSHQDIAISPAPANQGGSVTISALVRNQGFSAAQNVAVNFYTGAADVDGELLGSRTISTLDEGQSTSAAIDWTDIVESGETIITVQLDPDDLIEETNEDDNSAFKTLQILNLPDLVIATTSISLVPSAPREGEAVLIKVTVQNAGQQEVLNVPVKAYEGSSLLDAGNIALIPGNSQAIVSFGYDTAAKSGAHQIRIVVDPEDTILEQSEANNSAVRSFGVQDANLWLSEPYISPNGDGVKDSTQYFFRLQTPQTVEVYVVDENGHAVRTFSGSEFENSTGATITWDGLDHNGMVVPDGHYQIRLRDANDNILAGLPVIVDNNRSPLAEAIGTDYLLRSNLTCPLSSYSWQWFPDDSGMLIDISFPDEDNPEYPPGLYTVSSDGEDIYSLLPSEFSYDDDSPYDYSYYPHISPDAEKVAFKLYRWNRSIRKYDLDQLWVVDRYGDNLVQLDSYNPLQEDKHIRVSESKEYYWSPDSAWFVYKIRDRVTGYDEIRIVKPDGTAKTNIDSDGNFSDPRWSPDSNEIAYSGPFRKPDGTTINGLIISDRSGHKRIIFAPYDQVDTIHWFSNGRILASAGGQIWLIDTSGNGDHENILELDESDYMSYQRFRSSLAVSPDLKHFAFSQRDGDRIFVKVSDLMGNVSTLYEAPYKKLSLAGDEIDLDNISGLIWSNDGSKIAFPDIAYNRWNGFRLYEPHLIIVDTPTKSKKIFKIDDADSCYGWDIFDYPECFASMFRHFKRIKYFLGDNRSIMLEDEAGFFLMDSETGERFDYVVSGHLGTLSPLGRYITYSQYGVPSSGSYCKGYRNIWALGSLLNLTADLRATKTEASVMLKGIAADLNFAGYTLDYADTVNPDVWNLIAPPFDTPVANEVFTSWVPPYEGTFLVRLTVYDKAGNIKQDRKRVSWGRFSSITNLYKTEQIFSPNGDGVKDTVELHFRVLEPVHLEFYVYDQDENLVRTILKDYTAPVEDHITWDGRDEVGAAVPDGIYKIRVFDYEFFFEVDSTPPEVQLALSPIEFDKDIKTIFAYLSGRVDDANFKNWVVAYGQGENPQEWHEYKSGSSPLADVDDEENPIPALVASFYEGALEFTVGKKFRITAEDYAGNRSTAAAEFLEELVLLYKWKIPAHITGHGEWHPISLARNDRGNFLATDMVPALYTKPGLHELQGLETIRLPISRINVQYWQDMQWFDAPQVPDPPSGMINPAWDNSGPEPGEVDAVRIKVVDITAEEHYSNPVAIRDLFGIGYDCDSRMYDAKVSVFEDLVLLRFQVQSDQDERYSQWTDYKIFDTAQGDTIPLGTFMAPLPPDFEQMSGLRLKITATGVSGTEYVSDVFTYPQECPPAPDGGDFKLDLAVSYEDPPGCGSRSPAAEISAALKGVTPYQLKTLNYYMRESEEFKLLRSFALADERLNSVTIDTTGMPAGIYPVKAVLEYLKDGAASEIAVEGQLLVDHVLPGATITFPGSFTKLCPTVIAGPQGDRYGIHVEGMATDDNGVKGFKLYYGIGENPQTWLPARNTAGEPIAGETATQGRIGTWDVTDLTGTTFALMLKVVDDVGNVSCHTTSFDMDAEIHLAVSADKKLFSPNGDGNFDEVGIDYSTDEYATVSVKVLKDAAPVRTLVAEQVLPGDTQSVGWDGKDGSDQTVSDGVYEIVVAATDACGNTAQKRVAIEVDNTAPITLITHPQPNDPLGIVVEIKGRALDPHFESYYLAIAETDTSIANATSPVEDGILGTWNTFGFEGPWTLTLGAADQVGNRSETSLIIDLAERQDLILNLEAAPNLFSPNGDGKLENSAIRYELKETCDITLVILDSAGVIKQVQAAAAVSAGVHTFNWDGRDSAAVIVPDGTYTVKLSAASLSDPAVAQAETITLNVDATPPAVDLEMPLDQAYLKGVLTINGTIADASMSGYSISYAGGAGAQHVDAAAQNRKNHTFATLQDLPQGAYTLEVRAEDRGANITTKTIEFFIDRTPPQVTLQTPLDAEIYGGLQDKIPVNAAVEEQHPATYSLRYGPGDNPQTWTTLKAGVSLPAAQELLAWPVSQSDGVSDGLYTLSLIARDKAGWEAEARVKVVIDNDPPEVALTAPQAGQYVKAATDIQGTVVDANFAEYSVELSQGRCEDAFKWSLLKTSAAAVPNGALAALTSLPADGNYCLKLTAADQVDNQAHATVNFTIDTHPPDAPALSGEMQDQTDVVLTWTPNSEPDLVGYNLYRDNQRLNTDFITDTRTFDRNLAEGNYAYALKAVDHAGWESAPSNEITLRIDVTGPSAMISAPQDGSVVSALVDIKGTAFSSDDFRQYRVSIGTGSSPSAWILLRTSPVPSSNRTLARWDTLDLAEGSYSIRLETEDLSGNINSRRIVVSVDNTPPDPPVLLSAAPDGSDVELTWQAGSDADLAGYLIYRNHDLANVSGIVIGNLKPYLITGTTYADTGLPDGSFTYYLEAMDEAANISYQSNALEVVIENRAPRADIVAPADGHLFDQTLLITAQSKDGDIASIQFQYKWATQSAWTDLGGAVTTRPFMARLDPPSLALIYGHYQLRAVATDTAGKTDDSPSRIRVEYTDLTAPDVPEDLQARTTGEHLSLSWAANTEPDLAGYNVYQVSGAARTKLNAGVQKGVAYELEDLADGQYTYEITAVDNYGNESGPSDPATATVYAPLISQPYTPSPARVIRLDGRNAAADSTVEIFLETDAGAESQGTVPADDQGRFIFDTALSLGENRITARATDGAGNISRASDRVVVVFNEAPATPTGFVAAADERTVALSWNAITEPDSEPDLIGYNLYRDGDKLNPPSAVTSGAFDASAYDDMASRAFDANPSTYWYGYFSESASDHWWQIDLSSAELINSLEVEWYSPSYAGMDYEIQAWSGHTWITLAQVAGNAAKINTFEFNPSYRTNRVRIDISEATGAGSTNEVRIAEVRVIKENLITMPLPFNAIKLIVGDAAAGDYFGKSVSISGGYAIVGADGDDDGGNKSGSAYIFKGYGSNWTEQAKLLASDAAASDYFGKSVSISADYAVVGAQGNDDNGSGSGSAYIFKRVGSGWSEQAKLIASDAAAYDYFGKSVSISADYAIVGAYYDDNGGIRSGSAYIFKRDGSNWTEQAKLIASDAAPSDYFGKSVSISTDYAVVGADGDDDGGSNSGSAYIFKRDGSNWTEQAKLLASDAAAYDYFGKSVSISGDYVVVGADGDGDGGSNSGSAYIFKRDGSNWTEQAKLLASDAAAGDFFGKSVSISPDYALVGAYGDDDGGNSSGSAYIFKRDGSSWTEQAKLLAPDAAAIDYFGYSVSISADYAMMGAIYNDDGGGSSGSAYISSLSLPENPSWKDMNLPGGQYRYQVSAVDYFGLESPPSDEVAVAVGDMVAPGAPRSLTAIASGPDVILNWSANSEGDLAGYNLYQMTDQGWAKINSFLLTETGYTDAGLLNGPYTYRVTAVDLWDNESPPSDEAPALVGIALPESPKNLSVNAVPDGQAITICWEHADGTAAGYHIHRSPTAGGPYVRVNEELITQNCFLDDGLSNGLAYYYVVVAVDTIGNESVYSNEALSIPQDTVAPPAPEFFLPTISGRPLDVDRDKVEIVGLAEPAATVGLFKDGILVGETTSTEDDLMQSFSMDEEYLFYTTISPDGYTIAYPYESSLWLESLATGATTLILADDKYAYGVTWSLDSSKFAYEFYDENGDRRIGIYDIDTGSHTPLTDDTAVSERSLSWSHDGSRMAFISTRGGGPNVWVKDLALGAITRLTDVDDYIYFPELSPDGRKLAYIESGNLYVVDVDSGDLTLVDSQASIPAWSPQSTRLAFRSSRNGQPDIFVLDIDTLGITQITDSDYFEFSLGWSAGGRHLVYARWFDSDPYYDQIFITDAEQGGEGRLLDQVDIDSLYYLSWTTSGKVAYIAGDTLYLVHPQGHFSFSDVKLDLGENSFHATSADSSGNVGPPSGEIILLLDPGIFPDAQTLEDDIFIYPPFPIDGEKAIISVFVRNASSIAVEDVVVDIYLWDATGNLERVASETITYLEAYAEELLGLTWNSTGKAGENTVFVFLDAADQIVEASEENNFAYRDFYVAAEQGVELTATLDFDRYSSAEDVNIDVRIFNSGLAMDAVLEVRIEDLNGAIVAEIDTIKTALPYGSGKHYTLVWNSAHTYAGDYVVKAVLQDDSDFIVENTVPFTLVPDIRVESSLNTDRSHYGPNQDLRLDLNVTNSGQNYYIPALDVKFRILGENNPDLFAEDQEISNLLTGTTVTLSSTWNTKIHPPGKYTAIGEVFLDGDLIAGSAQPFSIDSSVIITGSISAAPAVILAGGSVEADYTVKNSGNAAANGLTLYVTVLDPETGSAIDTTEELIELGVNATHSGKIIFSTRDFALKSYGIILQYAAAQNRKNIASCSFTVKDGLAPVLTIISPEDGSTFDAAFDLAVRATDDASGIEKVQYRIDTGDWRPLPATDPAAGTYSTIWNPVEEDEGARTIFFRANDTAGNVSTPLAVAVVIELYTAFEKLSGTLAVVHDPVYRGREQSLSYSLSNDTNKATGDLTVRVFIVDPSSGDIKRTLEDATTVAAGSTENGGLAAPTLDLIPQHYKAILEVNTAEADEPRILAAILFEVTASLEAQRAVGDPVNLLVWVNDNCQSGQDCVREDLLEDILAAAVTDYVLVYDKTAFEIELRNPVYTDILILGDHQPVTDHHGAELQEKVFSGTGLISSHWLKHGSETEMFGINYKGQFSDGSTDIHLVASSICEAATTLQAPGKSYRIEAEPDTTIVGWFNDSGEDSPAVVLTDFSLGKTIYFAFDLGLTLNDENYDQLADLITASIEHIHQPVDTTIFYPYQFVPMELNLSSLGIGLDLEISETFDPELELFDPASGEWITENPWITNLKLAPAQAAVLRHYYLMPDLAGSYSAESEVDALGDGTSVMMNHFNLQMPIEHDITGLIDRIIANLNLLDLPKNEKKKVDNAIKDLEKARDRLIQSAKDVDQNIHDIIKAIEDLRAAGSAELTDIILKTDTLLRCEQGRYYYY